MAQASFYCPHCKQQKLFKGEDMNHTAHILASIFLCGLWLPIWIIAATTYQPIYRCGFCGFTDAVKYLSNPDLRNVEAKEAKARQSAHKNKLAGATGLKAVFIQIKNYEHINKIGVAIFMFCIVSAALILNLPINETSSITNPLPVKPTTVTDVNDSLSSKLKLDVSNGFNSATWYRSIKNILVKGNNIEVFTDLDKPDKTAKTICGAISGTYYLYNNSTQNETLLLFGKDNRLLVKRLGIAEQCK